MGKTCNKCKCVKPPRSHHCSTCGRCVLKMDHHCPWMNNCVGLRNQKAFLLFNFYTMITSLWTVIRVGIAWYHCSDNDECDDFAGFMTVLAVIMLLMCGIFALFTCIMFADQLQMMIEDTSTIDRMQARRAAKQTADDRKSQSKQVAGRERNPKKAKPCCGRGARCSPLFFLPCSFCKDLSVEN